MFRVNYQQCWRNMSSLVSLSSLFLLLLTKLIVYYWLREKVLCCWDCVSNGKKLIIDRLYILLFIIFQTNFTLIALEISYCICINSCLRIYSFNWKKIILDFLKVYQIFVFILIFTFIFKYKKMGVVFLTWYAYLFQ